MRPRPVTWIADADSHAGVPCGGVCFSWLAMLDVQARPDARLLQNVRVLGSLTTIKLKPSVSNHALLSACPVPKLPKCKQPHTQAATRFPAQEGRSKVVPLPSTASSPASATGPKQNTLQQSSKTSTRRASVSLHCHQSTDNGKINGLPAEHVMNH